MGNTFSRKIYLTMLQPSNGDIKADKERILDALAEQGYQNVHFTIDALRSIYPLVYDSEYKVTVTLCPSDFGWNLIRIEAGDTSEKNYGIALDIGSTTLEMQLIDLASGKMLATSGCVNSQTKFGLNILDRIIAIKEDRKNLETLRQLTVADINSLLHTVLEESGLTKQDISSMAVGGNTTMIHMFTGCDSWHVFQSPYTPAFYNPGIFPAEELDIDLICGVYCIPAVANYLGGDIVSGLLMTDIDKTEDQCIFLDIGTNGELALGNKHYLIVGAGAAGPALEGFGSVSGMRAAPGAVSGFAIDDEGNIHLEVIGNIKPKGICGGGIFDLIAECYLSGWIDGSGKINRNASNHCIEVWSETEQRTIPAVEYYKDEDISLYFTETDIIEFLKCKAAGFTMVATLLDYCGTNLDEVKKFYLAGGFGTHTKIESAITVGLYPDIDRSKFVVLGNSSLGGAKAVLMDSSNIDRINNILNTATYLQFGEMEKFVENMIAASFIPHTNADLYPNVVKERERRLGK